MGLVELTLVAIGLSMDAFAVAICKGLRMTYRNYKNCFIIALFFGFFQALMPLIGWFLGTRFEKYITSFDHWIAFVLLAIIGGKMIYDALSKKKETTVENSDKLKIKELLILSVATSIDALAVGITLALLPSTNIFVAIAIIGVITFVLSFVGVIIGNKFGGKFEKKAEFVGGIILIGIGLKILIEHLIK